jgi:hypothetical protein
MDRDILGDEDSEEEFENGSIASRSQKAALPLPRALGRLEADPRRDASPLAARSPSLRC